MQALILNVYTICNQINAPTETDCPTQKRDQKVNNSRRVFREIVCCD